MKSIVLAALLAAVGCSKKGPDCGESINKGMDKMAAALKANPAAAANPQRMEAMMGVVDKLRTTLTQRCTEDKWAAEALPCFAEVSGQREVRACEDKLTQDQRGKLTQQLQQIMLGMRSQMGQPGQMGDHRQMMQPNAAAGSAGTSPPGSAGGAAGSAAPSAPGDSPAPAGAAAPAPTKPAAAGSAAGAGW